MPLVIGRREGYRIWDVDGHELLDLHLNGGTHNLGHRHPELLEELRRGARGRSTSATITSPPRRVPSWPRRWRRSTPGDLHYSVFVPSRQRSQRSRHPRRAPRDRPAQSGSTLDAAFHGCTGLSAAAGKDGTAQLLQQRLPRRVRQGSLRRPRARWSAALCAGDDVAGVLLETIPATYGFPRARRTAISPGVKALCEKYGTLYAADEVQTGPRPHRLPVGRRGLGRRARHDGDRQGTLGRTLSDLRPWS